MPVTVGHVLSATTPDDPAFEIRPSHWNSAHAVTLNISGSDISQAFSNAGNVLTGSGAALTNVNASQLGGQAAAAYGRLAAGQKS